MDIKKRRIIALVTALLLTLTPLSAVGCDATNSILPGSKNNTGDEISVQSISGAAFIGRGSETINATVGMALNDGDMVFTVSDSMVLIQVDADKTIQLKEQTGVRLESQNDGYTLELVSGIVKVSIDKPLSDGEHFIVNAGYLAIETRGTVFTVGYLYDTVAVAVEEGTVAVTDWIGEEAAVLTAGDDKLFDDITAQSVEGTLELLTQPPFSTNLPDGHHSYMFLSCVYEGYFVNGLPNGLGATTRKNDNLYLSIQTTISGNFVNGLLHGIITYTYTLKVTNKSMYDATVNQWKSTYGTPMPDYLIEQNTTYIFEVNMGYAIDDVIFDVTGNRSMQTHYASGNCTIFGMRPWTVTNTKHCTLETLPSPEVTPEPTTTPTPVPTPTPTTTPPEPTPSPTPGPIQNDDSSFLESLTADQMTLLYRLIAALRVYDYATANAIQSSAEYRSIVDSIPEDKNDIRYDADENASIYFYRSGNGPHSYHADAYIGTSGSGVFVGSNHSVEFHVMHVADYSGGLANGSFIEYITDASGFTIVSGTNRNGQGNGKLTRERNGVIIDENEANNSNWWPQWNGQ